MSSGTPDERRVLALPIDVEARKAVLLWQGRKTDDLARSDLRGLDISGGNAEMTWFTESNLAGVRLKGCELYRSDFSRADLTGACLDESTPIRATFDGAKLVRATLRNATCRKSEMFGVDARFADFTGAEFGDSGVVDSDFRGACLAGSSINGTFRVTVDADTVFEGMTGSIIGAITVEDHGVTREISDTELESFFRFRGASIEIRQPAARRPVRRRWPKPDG